MLSIIISTIVIVLGISAKVYKIATYRIYVRIKKKQEELSLGIFTGGIFSLLDNGFKVSTALITFLAMYAIIIKKRG